MYESPITIKAEEIARNIMDKQEAYILTQVQMCVGVDKDELIKALEYDRGQYEKGWNDRDNEIVRCKDCKYYNLQHHYCEGIGNWFGIEGEWGDNGYCYKGEREDGKID